MRSVVRQSSRETLLARPLAVADHPAASSRAKKDSVLAPMRLLVRNLPTRPVTQTIIPIFQEPSIFRHISPENLEKFVDAIHAYDDEPVLRYSQRLSLIKLASKLNIRRFDANLIIASIERASRQLPGRPTLIPQPPAQSSWRSAWLIGLSVQAVLISGVCWVWYF